MTTTVMLIHGAWLAPSCWAPFKARYEAAGLHVIAPAWPHDERPIEQLRAAPQPELARLTIGRIVDHYERLIRAMDTPPILIGHSFGGLIVQLLLDRGLGAAGVAIDPAPPRGVPPSLVALYGALPIFLAWRGWRRTLTMSGRSFAWGFVQTLPPAEQRRLYDELVVPTPGRIYYQSAFASRETGVAFDNDGRAPLLLIAGAADRTVVRTTVAAVHRKYRRSTAITDYREFEGRPHLLIMTPGWEEIADVAIDWALNHVPAADLAPIERVA